MNLAAKLEKHCKEVGHPALVTVAALERAARQGLDLTDRFTILHRQRIAGVAGGVDIAVPNQALLPLVAPPHAGTATPPA